MYSSNFIGLSITTDGSPNSLISVVLRRRLDSGVMAMDADDLSRASVIRGSLIRELVGSSGVAGRAGVTGRCGSSSSNVSMTITVSVESSSLGRLGAATGLAARRPPRPRPLPPRGFARIFGLSLK